MLETLWREWFTVQKEIVMVIHVHRFMSLMCVGKLVSVSIIGIILLIVWIFISVLGINDTLLVLGFPWLLCFQWWSRCSWLILTITTWCMRLAPCHCQLILFITHTHTHTHHRCWWEWKEYSCQTNEVRIIDKCHMQTHYWCAWT